MPTIEISPLVKKPPRHFSDLSPENRAIAVTELGEPAFRAKQLANHYFGRHNETPEAWSDISIDSATKLATGLFPTLLTKVRSVTCDGGTTRKDLWKLHDGVLVESVLMRYPDRATLCISSQAGCGMGCPFCATGQAGLTRNLSAGEITAQVFAASRAM
ncbi:MAG: 23S rRNA (adenine(2503)-C(2))-methyltransferase RlmN, partial [Actinomycetes bacterium]